MTATCRSCRSAEEAWVHEATERAVLESRGVHQIVAALSAPGGLSTEVFNRFRSQGVQFQTASPWAEVKRLYEDYPIDTGEGMQYFLILHGYGPLRILGPSETSYDLEVIPAVYMRLVNSEGYQLRDGLLTADGKVLTAIHSRSDSKVFFESSPRHPQDHFRSASAATFIESRRILKSYRREIELRIEEDASVCISDDEAQGFVGRMLEIWKKDDPAELHLL